MQLRIRSFELAIRGKLIRAKEDIVLSPGKAYLVDFPASSTGYEFLLLLGGAQASGAQLCFW